MYNLRSLLLIANLLISTGLLASNQLTPESEWWRNEIVYQVYPRSFRDSDGDGTGDIKGITQKLDYIKSIGAKSIWVSPIYPSPMVDFGYDISNHTDIDPMFGSMADFDELLLQVHQRDMHLIMDFVPNHTSDQHAWFQSSRHNSTGQHANFYIWKNCTQPEVSGQRPGGVNNWLSNFGGSAWSFDSERQQCYLHQFAKEQPDLNFRELAVRQRMIQVLRFWLEKGVDGIRADAVRHLVEDELFRDEPQVEAEELNRLDAQDHASLKHVHTADQAETYSVMQEWRELIDEVSLSSGRRRLLVSEAYSDLPELMRYYGVDGQRLADFPFNFGLLTASKRSGASRRICGSRCLHKAILSFHDNMPRGAWPNWVLGNHDNSRIASRYSPAGRFVRSLNTLLLVLPGTPTCYYGDELGMEDLVLGREQMVDPLGLRFPEQSRDPARAPMLWDSSSNAGFSAGDGSEQSWLPVEPDHASKCVQTQLQQLNSTLAAFKAVAALRLKPEFLLGDLRFLLVDDRFLVFSRGLQETSFIVALYISELTDTARLQLQLTCSAFDLALDLRSGLSPAAIASNATHASVAMAPGDAVIFRAEMCESGVVVSAVHAEDSV